MRMRFVAAVLFAGSLVATPAWATFHLMNIIEVFPGTVDSPSAQYVTLEMTAAGQNFVGGHSLQVFDASGTVLATLTFGGNVLNGSTQSAILIATTEAQTLFGVTADLAMAGSIPRTGGKVCWADTVDCVAWGNYAGPSTGVGAPFSPADGLLPCVSAGRRRNVNGSLVDTNDSANDFQFQVPSPRNNAGVVGALPPSPTCPALVTIAATTPVATENGPTLGMFTVTRAGGDASIGLNVNYAVGGSATASSDYGALPGSVLIPMGSPTGSITVTPVDDALVESDETVVVTLTPGTGYVVGGSATATVTIVSDDGIVGGTAAIALDVDAAGNGVLEPGETVTVAPTWRNVKGQTVALGGSAVAFTGPPGATYTILDGTADYGTLAPGAMAACATATGNCYTLAVSAPTMRPAAHWDLSFEETLSNGRTEMWILHVGESFTDVPPTNPFYRFIETLLHVGVTAGCSGTTYCPDGSTTREQMAVFLLRAKEGGAFAPPPCTTAPFPDVPCSSPFATWIQELVARGITAGCGGGRYCPTSPVTREQMAVFLLKTHDGAAFTPPPCIPAPFADVPCVSPFAPWVQALVARGITAGCGGGLYCPTDPVTRGQMAVFLTKTFGLTLYGP